MFASAQERTHLFKSRLSIPSLVRLLLDPVVIIVTLFGAALAHRQPFDSPYVILSMIVFSLTFPGTSHLTSSTRALARDVVLGWLLLFCFLLFFGYATKSLQAFSPAVLLAWFLAAPLTLFASHQTVRVVLPRVLNLESNQRKAIIIGANGLGLNLSHSLRDAPFLGIKLVGFFDDRALGRLGDLEGVPLHGTLAYLPAFVKQSGIDLIYIALPMASQPRILNVLDELRDTTSSIYFVPDIFVSDLIQARVDNVGGIPLVAVCETPFYGVNGVIKRLSDVLLSCMILVPIAPLMIAIALCVKLDSPGPILFRQRRYGLDGKEIVVYKFRTMSVCEDGAAIVQATKNDCRITRFGAFLRKSSLDELPQFINVVQGRMSIVGPRPHAVAHNEMYRKLIKGYMVRHKVRPGITGWAQVNGLRGETDTLEKMRARIEHDLAYLRNWSLKLDLQIILRTILIVARDRHAY